MPELTPEQLAHAQRIAAYPSPFVAAGEAEMLKLLYPLETAQAIVAEVERIVLKRGRRR
jgi:hypothetical protein